MKKITEEYWMVWTLNNWDGLVYYHGQDGELKRNDFVGAHRFKTYEAAERVVKALEKKNWLAGFDNVQITHAWTVGRFDRHHEDVYRGRLKAAYAA